MASFRTCLLPILAAAKVDYEDFMRWLKQNPTEENRANVVWHLAMIFDDGAQVLEKYIASGKQRQKERKKPATSDDEEITTAVMNGADNLVETYKSALVALAPLRAEYFAESATTSDAARAGGQTDVPYEDWFAYLRRQFAFLAMVEEFVQDQRAYVAGLPSASVGTFGAAREQSFVSALVDLGADLGTVDAARLSLASVRDILLFRIQACLASRVSFGVFEECVHFYTDSATMAAELAAKRYVATLCGQRVMQAHKETDDAGPARYTHRALLALFSRHSADFDALFALKAGEFPIMYKKKPTPGFCAQVQSLLDAFKTWLGTLTRQQLQEWRADDATTQKSADSIGEGTDDNQTTTAKPKRRRTAFATTQTGKEDDKEGEKEDDNGGSLDNRGADGVDAAGQSLATTNAANPDAALRDAHVDGVARPPPLPVASFGVAASSPASPIGASHSANYDRGGDDDDGGNDDSRTRGQDDNRGRGGGGGGDIGAAARVISDVFAPHECGA